MVNAASLILMAALARFGLAYRGYGHIAYRGRPAGPRPGGLGAGRLRVFAAIRKLGCAKIKNLARLPSVGSAVALATAPIVAARIAAARVAAARIVRIDAAAVCLIGGNFYRAESSIEISLIALLAKILNSISKSISISVMSYIVNISFCVSTRYICCSILNLYYSC